MQPRPVGAQSQQPRAPAGTPMVSLARKRPQCWGSRGTSPLPVLSLCPLLLPSPSPLPLPLPSRSLLALPLPSPCSSPSLCPSPLPRSPPPRAALRGADGSGGSAPAPGAPGHGAPRTAPMSPPEPRTAPHGPAAALGRVEAALAPAARGHPVGKERRPLSAPALNHCWCLGTQMCGRQ